MSKGSYHQQRRSRSPGSPRPSATTPGSCLPTTTSDKGYSGWRGVLRPDRRAERLARRAVALLVAEFPDRLLPDGDEALAELGRSMADSLAAAARRAGIAAEDVADALAHYLS